MSSIKELRMQLSEDDIKNILARYGTFTAAETETSVVFPTACHNLTGGSPKLYYYRDEKIFQCFTQCNCMFDIFDLILRMEKLRGNDIGLRQAILLTGVEQNEEISKDARDDLEYLRKLRDASNNLLQSEEEYDGKILDKDLINRFTFNLNGVKPWMDEGISIEALNKFNIRYDSTNTAIVIPNLDHDGNLVGIRGRFFGIDAKAKYMPLRYNGKILSHPTGKFLYGFYENNKNISKTGIAILFEGEKSVLKMETLYPGKNISLATTGKKISLDQLDALLKLKIREVVLAYDRDYRTPAERKEKLAEYDKIISILKPYFEVSVMADFEKDLEYKDSPIDQGKEVFDKLMKERIKR